jgi:hypothetical protein
MFYACRDVSACLMIAVTYNAGVIAFIFPRLLLPEMEATALCVLE